MEIDLCAYAIRSTPRCKVVKDTFSKKKTQSMQQPTGRIKTDLDIKNEGEILS